MAPACIECGAVETMLWRASDNGDGQICQDCYELQEKRQDNSEAANKGNEESSAKDSKEKEVRDTNGSRLNMTKDEKRRKSTRSTRSKVKPSASSTTSTNGSSGISIISNSSSSKTQIKGRSRRSIFKKIPHKTPVTQATTHLVKSVFHKNTYFQVGDIVSLADADQNVFYAQIRGLLVDNYCEKSAYLTWLIPTQASPDPKVAFDAATYLIGPDEELSRKLSYLDFVMHAPSNYYLDRTTPFPLPDVMVHEGKSAGFIWTRMPEYQRRMSAM